MTEPRKSVPSRELRAGVKWEGCSSAPDGKHALREGERVDPFESFVCRHCRQMIWWDFDPKGGY